MRELPNELLQCIFSLSCYDGGQTACALRCVCRRFRDGMEKYRFQSVALEWRNQIPVFLDVVKKSSRTSREGIRHLFLLVDVDWRENEPDLIANLISLVAPRLQTICCIINEGRVSCVIPTVRRTAFPHLTHLTLWHRELSTGRIADPFGGSLLTAAEGPKPPNDLYPSLTNLHITFSGATSLWNGHSSVLALVRRAPPDLNIHVRLSGITLHASSADDFAVILRITAPTRNSTGTHKVEMPRSIARYTLVLHKPAPIGRRYEGYNGAFDDAILKSVSRTPVKAVDGPDVEVLLPTEPPKVASQWKGEWLEMLGSGLVAPS
ncbi:hypothetical protein OE88DRAFT_177560 [Heliocybe sulcata]|uniref:F-box domain-containing protein n=1 Tax=Heliocybe sulcata TaxID=5364 RepID=A0A5C3N0H3_9AGAM|nr:hypothetical protein OE88DRAFT_177560 [Heliocybe sulcata]